jgi:hypothetical protein
MRQAAGGPSGADDAGADDGDLLDRHEKLR